MLISRTVHRHSPFRNELFYFLPYIKLHRLFFSRQVFAATWETGPAEEREAVLKVQMPPNDWEWYIISEVHARFDSLSHPLKDDVATSWKKGFMSAPRCFTYSNGAILVSQQQKMGTLLDLVNLTKGGGLLIN